jgi:hypothetical protein
VPKSPEGLRNRSKEAFEAKNSFSFYPDLALAGASTRNKLHRFVDVIDFLRVGGENSAGVKNKF